MRVVLGLALVAALGCTKHREPRPERSVPPGIFPGARVLGPHGRVIFFEYEVDHISGTRVTMKPKIGEAESFDAAELVVPPERAERGPLAPGTPVLAFTGDETWLADTIEGKDGDRHLLIHGTEHHRVARSDIFAAPPRLVPTIVDHALAERTEREAKSLVPYRPSGWNPRANEAVLYSSGGEWFAGKLSEAKDGLYRIAPERHRLDRWLGPLSIGPVPASSHPAPRKDEIVLVRRSAEWTVARVLSVSGDRVDVLTQSANREAAAPGDLARLVARRDAWLPRFAAAETTMSARSLAMHEFLTEIGVTRFDFHPHADGTIKWVAGERRLAEARYRIILSWGPYRRYTMGFAVGAFADQGFPVVPRESESERAVYDNVLQDAAWEHAARVAQRIGAEFFYPASTLYVAVDDFRLTVPKAELEQRDLSAHSRAILASASELTVRRP